MADNERLNAILCQFDIDWSSGDEARTEATNDLYFSRVSQWDDWLCEYTTLQYRGQFDVVRPVVRKLVAEMRRNPIDVLYRPKDGSDPDSADVLMGMYRTDMRHNSARTAVNIAVREQIECGVGHWRLVTEYEDNSLTSRNQVIRRRPLHESCSHVVWDCNSKEQDKSDAKHCTVIQPFSTDGWKAFAEENGIDPDIIPTFQSPDMGWMFPWISKDVVYVGEHYEVEVKNEKVFIYQDPITGEPVSYYQRDIKDVIDDLAEKGYVKIAERKVKRRRVYKSLITCTEILKERELIAGEYIPIVPAYGEWGFAGDKEVYEGVVRLTKDGQRLRNMIMSFNADIVARNPQKKPFFYPEQIAGFENMYGGDDAYPYYLLNRTDENGADLPPSPVAYMENPEVPQANAYMLEAATGAVKEVASIGVDTEAAGGQVAFDTVNQLNMRADLETYVFQDNLATAMRRDGEIYQSMVNDIYDVPRSVTMTLPDGSEKDVQILSQVVDYQTGNVVTLNDIRGRYECYTDVGPSFQSMKEQNRAEIQELLTKVPQGTPEFQMLMLQYFTLLDGQGVEMMREYANKQLVMMGLKKPETPEEIQMVQQAQQQPQKPSSEDIAAQGVLLQGQAELLKAQNQQMQIQVDAAKVEGQNQLNSAKIAEIFNSMDLDKKAAFRDFLKMMGSFQQNRSDDARANAELLLKGADQTHSQRMDLAGFMQSMNQNPSGGVAENPQ
jgi:hypothetical protein